MKVKININTGGLIDSLLDFAVKSEKEKKKEAENVKETASFFREQFMGIKYIALALVVIAALSVSLVPGMKPLAAAGLKTVTLMSIGWTIITITTVLAYTLLSAVLYLGLLVMIPVSILRGPMHKDGQNIRLAGSITANISEQIINWLPALTYWLVMFCGIAVIFQGNDALAILASIFFPRNAFLKAIASIMECFIILSGYMRFKISAIAPAIDHAYENSYGRKPGRRTSAVAKIRKQIDSDKETMNRLRGNK